MIKSLKSGRPTGLQQENDAQVRTTVEQMLSDIETNGEAAVRHYSEKLDNWSPASFRLSQAEIDACMMEHAVSPTTVVVPAAPAGPCGPSGPCGPAGPVSP